MSNPKSRLVAFVTYDSGVGARRTGCVPVTYWFAMVLGIRLESFDQGGRVSAEGMADWLRVSRSEPCPVCAKSDWCQRSADGLAAHCMRLKSPKPAKGDGGGWIHKLDQPLIAVLVEREKEAKPEIDWDATAMEMFNSAKADETRNSLAQSLGVKVAALAELGVGRGWDDYRGLPFSSWPERDATGKVLGIVRRYEDGSKKTMRYSSHGIYFTKPVLRMRNGPVFLVEGGSDTAALLSVGVNAIGRPSNLGGVQQIVALARTLGRCTRLIVVGERDEKPDGMWPGRQGAVATAERLTEELKRKVKWIMPPAKDVRAWLNQQGSMDGPQFLKAVNAW